MPQHFGKWVVAVEVVLVVVEVVVVNCKYLKVPSSNIGTFVTSFSIHLVLLPHRIMLTKDLYKRFFFFFLIYQD